MPRIKDLAATLLAAGWNTPPHVFEILWRECEKVPSQATSLHGPQADTALSRTLAASSATSSPNIIAVFICSQAAQQLPDNASIEEITQALLAIGTTLHQQGVARRLVVLSDAILSPMASTARSTSERRIARQPNIVATIYTHDQPDGYAASKQEREDWLRKISSVTIFIRHELNLPYGYKGELYLRKGGGPPVLDDEMPKLQYNILRHLLRHQATQAKRTLPAIIEACWRNDTTAVEQAAALQQGTRKQKNISRNYDTAITKLSKLLQKQCGIVVQSGQSGIYELQPRLPYCLIEEALP